MAKLKIGELLSSKGLINDAQIRVALAQQAITGDFLGDTLIKLGFVSSKEMAQALAEQAGIEFIELDRYEISEDALRLIPREIAEGIGFLPLNINNGSLSIAITNPTNLNAIDTATRVGGGPPRVFMSDSETFHDVLERSYYFLENPIHKRIEEEIKRIKASDTVPVSAISSLTECIIMDGVRRKATDIHINPSSEAVHVSYRIDGVLQHAHCLPRSVQAGMISRIKVLSQLDIAEQRLPQDGSFTFSFLNKDYEMRTSVIPAIYGENVVLRVLGGGGILLSITNLGFDKVDTMRLRRLFLKPYGMILITGPTGSGKTTTLYAALKEIDIIEKNVLTVEDPVEYKLSMVKQTKVSLKSGYDFAMAGRNFMRQDPDVILIGEIRDEETARIAIRASITGHLVLSTLHTNDSVTTIPRLLDLNVDPFLLSSSILAVVAQRLVRRICSNCKTEHLLRKGDLGSMGFHELEGKIRRAFKGKGCEMCGQTGYLGRTVIGEILIADDAIKELIYSRSSVGEIKKKALEGGMKTMRDNGIRKAIDGITTFEEIQRVIG